MEREALNAYLDALLNIAGKAPFEESELRTLLVEEAMSSNDFDELLTEWIWMIHLGPTEALKLKVWLGLSYSSLAKLYRKDPKEIQQWLRNLRSRELPPYQEGASSLASAPSFGGLSCFMAEQYLSAWLDLEVDELWALKAVHEHLANCTSCQGRAEEYRKLQHQILKENIRHPDVDEKEWMEIAIGVRSQRRRLVARILLVTVSALILVTTLGWFFWSKPEPSPNIYEMKEP